MMEWATGTVAQKRAIRRSRAARLPRAIAALGVVLLGAACSGTAREAPPQMIRIPADTVRLGSTPQEKAFGYSIGGAAARRWRWFDRERERTVTLEGFAIDPTPVTQSAYAAFVRATGHRAPFISEADYRRQGFLVHPYSSVAPYLWRNRQPPAGRGDHPVVLVSVADARAFCAWRGARPGPAPRPARGTACGLPSEDQWELAARGTDRRYFPWGNRWAPERANTQAKGPYGTTPVHAHPAGRSPYGLYDMAGNVFEWTATTGRPGYNILKGCSWDDLGGICRAAARHGRRAASRHILIGFRCACAGGSDAAGRPKAP